MKLKTFIHEFYNLFSKRVSSNHSEDINLLNLIDKKEIVLRWRKKVFMIIFASFLVFITVPYCMSVRFVIQHKMWVSFTVYTLSYISIFIIVFFRQIPFKTRVIIGLFAFYSLGVVAFVYAVAGGSGKLYLMSSSILATLLIGIKFGIFSIFINALTLLVVGYFVANGAIVWIDGNPVVMKVYILTGTTFLFLNSVITISLAALVSALEINLIESQNAAYELKKANDELLQNQKKREKLEAQLIQAQKMESIGRLAGGVAHDYNNISSIIIGYSELALEKVKKDDELYDNLTQIYSAAKRSADITRQLLAFARQQTVSPKVFNLNDTVENMLKMLKKLIGEDVDLAWLPGADLGQIKIDPSQIDQILVNLCVNARDAIADVGKVTIETENVLLDEAYCDDHAESVEGEFVMLVVSDDGCGISSENLDKLFDPFFTTKDIGKGTGLGLATVYGIVKQNNGFINVYSEVDKGTTFKIYLPRHSEKIENDQNEIAEQFLLSQGETLLLVEDDLSILKLVERMLKSLGYTVLPVNTPNEAIAKAEGHKDPIHILVTDVVMPEMNGRELSEELKKQYPNLKTVFMSGYTANVIAQRGVLEDGIHFIQKPFSKNELAKTIRRTLGETKG